MILKKRTPFIGWISVGWNWAIVASCAPVGTAFTYQDQLKQKGKGE